jgi:hypothetical protein
MGRKRLPENEHCKSMSISMSPDLFILIEKSRRELKLTRSEFFQKLIVEWNFEKWFNDIREAEKEAAKLG